MFKKVLIVALLFSIPFFMSDLSAFDWGKKKKARELTERAKADSIKKKTSAETYKKLFGEKHIETKGLINLHKIKGKIYFEVPLGVFGKEMLLGSTISETSDNGNSILGSKPNNPLLVNFTLKDNKILFNRVVKTSVAPSGDTNIRDAIAKNNIGAIISIFNVETYNSDSTAVVFDATEFFVSDSKELNPFDGFSKNSAFGSNQRTYTFQKDKSFLSDIKSFSNNISVKSTLSYNVTVKNEKTTLFSDRPYTVVVTRSFLLLDEKPYDYRLADSRIAIFNSEMTKYSDRGDKAEKIHYAHRWRLEPSDKATYLRGEAVEPITPIIFYIDPDFPEWWRPYIKRGVEQWNDAFLKIGFKKAVKAMDYPTDNPDFDPDNIKYSCVRYSPIQIANAMGPSWVDPRSGEIINASVYIYHDVIKLINSWLFVQTSQTDARVRKKIIPQEVMGEALRYVVSHEVGHCLAFMHNMGSSSVIPVDSLRSPSFTQKYGTTMSIMDYARFNYVAQPGDFEKGVNMMPPKLGPYDDFLVKWLYSPIPGVKTPEEEYTVLSKWLTEKSGDKIYRYGKQDNWCDPTCQSEDLGDDAIKASIYGINNLKLIMKNFNSWLESDDIDYSHRAELYKEIINQYYRYATHVNVIIGGMIINERVVGDKIPLFEIVSKEKQKAALKFLLDQVSDLKWLEEKSVIENLPLQNSMVDILRDKLVEYIMYSPSRVHFGATKTDKPYTTNECLDDIYSYTFKSLSSANTPTQTEMKLQRAFVEGLISSANLKSENETTIADTSTDLITIKPIEGFGSLMFNYSVPPACEKDYYRMIIKAKADIQKRLTNCSKESSLHYKLLLRRIDKAIK